MLACSHEQQLAKVIDLVDRFDKSARQKFDTSIKEVLTGHYAKVVLNFGELLYIDSSGLGKVTLAYLDLKTNGIDVTIMGLPPKIKRLLDRHGLSRLLFSKDSVSEYFPIT